MKYIYLIFLLYFALLTSGVKAQLLAFPGAEGFGRYATGGRGGIVVYVTNLNDSGKGSLRDALEGSSYKGKKRTVVFSVSGTIELKSAITIKTDSYVTIAGQTAPGDGICIKNFPIRTDYNSHDIIVRYLRFRPGDQQDCGDACDYIDAMSIRQTYNIIVDHCSMGWSIDDVLDLTVSTGYSTIQYCLLHEPLVDSKHPKGAHGYIAGWDGSSYGANNVFGGGSYHHNLLATAASRTPRLDKYPDDKGHRDLIDIVNNVIYNWSGYGAYGGEAADVNWQNNYHKWGPNTSNKKQIFLPGDTCRMYLSGNYVDGYPLVTADNSKGIESTTLLSVAQIVQSKPYTVYSIAMQTAEDAYKQVLAHSGAFLPVRDAVDLRIVNDVVMRTGKNINSPADVGGYPVLNSTTAPTDTDLDGMPDEWEIAHNLDKNNAEDRNATALNNYTNLENYLNSIEFKNEVSNVIFKYNNDGQVMISWDDIFIGENGYKVERSVNGGAYELIATTPANAYSYADATVTQSEGIAYRVSAFQDGGQTSKTGALNVAKSLKLNVADTISTAQTIAIAYTVEPANTSNQIFKWELEQSGEFARIDKAGNLTPLKPGVVTISAKTTDGSAITATKKIVITEPVTTAIAKTADDFSRMVRIFPNPSNDGHFSFSFDFPSAVNANVEIFDVTGSTVYSNELTGNGTQQINHSFNNGVYFARIIIGKQTVIKKLLVNRK